MKYIETPWSKVSRFLGLGFGIPFTLLGVLWYWYDGNTAFLWNGAVWNIIAVLFWIKDVWNAHRRINMLRAGDCYEASHIKIIPSHIFRIGNYITARIQCKYRINDEEREATSGLYLLSPWDKMENLYALIYVSKDNKNRYEVVACRRED